MTVRRTRAGGKAWIAEVERACAAQGLLLTAARRSVLDILGHSRAALGAYAILDALARKDGKPVAPPTVYRALEFFLAHGFLHKIESRNAYAPCEHIGHAPQGVLLLCEKCGRSDEIEDDEVARLLIRAAERAGFAPHRQMVEMQGLCRACGQTA